MNFIIPQTVSAEDLAEAIAQHDPSQFIELVMEVLDNGFQTLEIDEELIARIWRKIRPCYEGVPPTLDELVEEYCTV
jgi:hypothetical protein